MKFTNSEVITTGERELIDTITGDLDWDAIENVFRGHHGLGIGEDIEYKNGDIVVHDGRVAYKLEFEVKVILSLLLDREGNYISVKSSAELEGTDVANGYERAILELDPPGGQERADFDEPSGPGEEDSQERISRIAYQSGQLIADLVEGSSP